jgi:putative PEP-CTERM system histidine kinase
LNLQQAPVVVGMVASLVPVVAVHLRPHSRLLGVATVATAAAMSFHLFVLHRLAGIGPANAPDHLVHTLAATAVPILLTAYLLSVSLGRSAPEAGLRRSRRTLLYLGSAGIAAVLLLRRPAFITAYDWADGMGTIHLGALGKAYLSYLLVGVIIIGYNLESTYRFADSGQRHSLRLPFLGFFAILAYYTFVLTTGILYSSLGLGKLIAAGMPIAIAAVFIGYGFLRGAITDVSAPVSRNIVYSSFTAVAAGLYVLAVGIVAQVATFTKWSPDEVVTLSFGFLATLMAVLLLLSNRFQRMVRRFIDRNFYVNRYDYRTQWSNVTWGLSAATEREEVLRCADAMLRDIFLADEITVGWRGHASPAIRPHMGKGTGDGHLVLEEDTPLYEHLRSKRRAMLLDRRSDDFEYIPIYAENRFWLDATASQMIAPLLDGKDLVGTVGMERNHKDDSFTFEDVALLESVVGHVASTLRSARLAEELAESREMDMVAQWSNMLLHDLKNYLSPLRMVAQNVLEFRDRPDIADIAAQDIRGVADRMEALVRKLSDLRENPRLEMQRVDMDELVQKTLAGLQVNRRSGLQLQLDLETGLRALGDEQLLRRVLENLVTNSIEAMNGEGRLGIRTAHRKMGHDAKVHLSVDDAGCGISDAFLKERLFRPFATTKKDGLGLGLYQSRAIVRAHGGEFHLRSKPGCGTTVEIVLPGVQPENQNKPVPRTYSEPRGVSS